LGWPYKGRKPVKAPSACGKLSRPQAALKTARES